MLFGVAVIVTALVVSTLAAVVVDTTYQAISKRHWLTALPLVGMGVAFALVAGASYGSLLG
jgi:predicted MFS family arabinose efflux permease